MSDSNSTVAVVTEEMSLEDWEQVRAYVRVTDKGLVWDEDAEMPPEVFGHLCKALGGVHKASRWAIGDALVWSQDRSEDYAQYEDEFGLAYHTLQQYRRVAARIPFEERNGAPWTALQITAHLDPETRHELIADYHDGVIATTDDLRDEVKALRTGPECTLLPPCPQCGGKLSDRKCKECGMDFPAAVWWIKELLEEKGEDDA